MIIDKYGELSHALGCDPMDSHAGRLERAKSLRAKRDDVDPQDNANRALACECGSVRWCLLQNSGIECHECGAVLEHRHWGPDKADVGEIAKDGGPNVRANLDPTAREEL